ERPRFWREDSMPRGVHAIWCDGLDHIWTDGGHSYLWDGERWRDMQSPYAGYGYDMSANHRNDILICGSACTILHWNGKGWRNWWKWPGLETVRFLGIDV